MIQTKLFDSFNSINCGKNVNLDAAINSFLQRENVELIDIKYQMTYTPPQQEHGWDAEAVYSALVIYRKVK